MKDPEKGQFIFEFFRLDIVERTKRMFCAWLCVVQEHERECFACVPTRTPPRPLKGP